MTGLLKADPSATRSASSVCCIVSKRFSSGSNSWLAAASVPRNSISDSILCAISPRRRAPANRALPFRVCKTRSTSLRVSRLAGLADHWRSAAPSCGMSSVASSSKMGKSSASIASTASISSSCTSLENAGVATWPGCDVGKWNTFEKAALIGVAAKTGSVVIGTAAVTNNGCWFSVTSTGGAMASGSNSKSFKSCGSTNSIPVSESAKSSARNSAKICGSDSFRKPAANWCKSRLMSSAALTNRAAYWSAAILEKCERDS